MADLILKEVEPAIVEKLQERAEQHSRSLEDEHKAILHDVLLPSETNSSKTTFEQYLRQMPDVGTDADFCRIEGTIRSVDLAD